MMKLSLFTVYGEIFSLRTHISVEFNLPFYIILHHGLEVGHSVLLEVVHLGQCCVGDDISPRLHFVHFLLGHPTRILVNLGASSLAKQVVTFELFNTPSQVFLSDNQRLGPKFQESFKVSCKQGGDFKSCLFSSGDIKNSQQVC